ncbi:A-agglutinin anchorage subunit isoform X2 [Nilaparvata lugens]|uniref:A-agglutinin anchorage subunit isoform X2 n=1 Tax=Nilaparvata lugens TaxID=108931 RepID=UPI000B9863C3|nr:A-agglutinin anchorage subunit isoform X2 [Nilaparvata lugens]XP_039296197.1 A-agglutinin anchorage subunit isoform X2 [Nilaparvata lugens]
MDTSATESPLDVLSRAATMLQDNAPLPPSYDEARFHLKCKEMAAAANVGKWKRERRSRPATATPPAYPLKAAQISQHTEPIDMSTRKIRGSPPSYSQTISAGYINRPPTTTNSPITNTNSVTVTADVDTDADSSMPVIDEHFRRSLGKHYQSVFAPSSANSSASSLTSSSSSPASSRTRITSNGQTTDDSSSDSADNAGSALSVDEHFAKALGETWLKLQQKEKSTSMTNGGSHLSSSSSSSTMTITTTTNSPLVLLPSSAPDHALLRINRIEP